LHLIGEGTEAGSNQVVSKTSAEVQKRENCESETNTIREREKKAEEPRGGGGVEGPGWGRRGGGGVGGRGGGNEKT